MAAFLKFDYLKLVERKDLQGQVRNQLQRFRFVKNADIGDIKVVISQGRAQNVDLLFCYRLPDHTLLRNDKLLLEGGLRPGIYARRDQRYPNYSNEACGDID